MDVKSFFFTTGQDKARAPVNPGQEEEGTKARSMRAGHADVPGSPQQGQAAAPRQHPSHYYAGARHAGDEGGGALGAVQHSPAHGALREAQPHGGGRHAAAGATRPNAGTAPERRLLDYYDFYRTPDNKKVRLGGGNYATVWKGVSRTTGEEVAFKIIVKNDITVAEANPMHAEILKMVDHKHIIQLKDYFDEEKALCLVLELATGGDIVERVHSAGVFTEAAAVKYSRQILTALAHCHKRGLVHCDIKCENILFASRDADPELKIADFGLAQLLQRGDKLMAGACACVASACACAPVVRWRG